MYKRSSKFRQSVKEHFSVNVGAGKGSTVAPRGRSSDPDKSLVRSWSRSVKRKAVLAVEKAQAALEAKAKKREASKLRKDANTERQRKLAEKIAKEIIGQKGERRKGR